MIGKLNMDPIDNVSRDNKDGTYRCPQCQTPFTRRSNLRRHFQIHLRGSSLKCEVCNEEHSTKDSLEDHVNNSHSPTSWNVSHEKPLQGIVIPQDVTSANNPHGPFASVSPPNYGHFSSHNPSMSQYTTLASPAPGRAFQVPNFGRLSLLTSGSTNASVATANVPRPTSALTSDRHIGPPPRSNQFSHRRSSTSSSSITSSPIASSSHYTRPSQSGPHQGHYGLYPPSEASPLSTHEEWIANIMGPRGPDGDDRPVYTRQQVKTMLDVVTDCFIESVASVLNNANASHQRPPNPARSNNHSTALDGGVRQMIMSEAIPRLFSRIEGTDDITSNGGYQTWNPQR